MNDIAPGIGDMLPVDGYVAAETGTLAAIRAAILPLLPSLDRVDAYNSIQWPETGPGFQDIRAAANEAAGFQVHNLYQMGWRSRGKARPAGIGLQTVEQPRRDILPLVTLGQPVVRTPKDPAICWSLDQIRRRRMHGQSGRTRGPILATPLAVAAISETGYDLSMRTMLEDDTSSKQPEVTLDVGRGRYGMEVTLRMRRGLVDATIRTHNDDFHVTSSTFKVYRHLDGQPEAALHGMIGRCMADIADIPLIAADNRTITSARRHEDAKGRHVVFGLSRTTHAQVIETDGDSI